MEGIKHVDTFSLVSKITIIRVLLELALIKGGQHEQLNANTTFLQVDLNKEEMWFKKYL